MTENRTSSCIELSEIRKLDQLLTQCETSSCEHICRDCCAKLGSLEDITDHQDDEQILPPIYHNEQPNNSNMLLLQLPPPPMSATAAAANLAQQSENHNNINNCEGCAANGIGNRGGGISKRGRGDVNGVCGGGGGGDDEERLVILSEKAQQGASDSVIIPKCELNPPDSHGFLNSGGSCFLELPLTHLGWSPLSTSTSHKSNIYSGIDNYCERQSRLEMKRQKKHSLTIVEKPTKICLTHKYSSENCLKQQAPPSLHEMDECSAKNSGEDNLQHHSSTGSGGKGRSKLSPQMLARRISCKVPDDLEPSAREALLGHRFGSLHEKKLPEPVETVCFCQFILYCAHITI